MWLQWFHSDNIHVYFFPGIERGSDWTDNNASEVPGKLLHGTMGKVRLPFISLALQELLLHVYQHEKDFGTLRSALWDFTVDESS